jgi:hypothetical protein
MHPPAGNCDLTTQEVPSQACPLIQPAEVPTDSVVTVLY